MLCAHPLFSQVNKYINTIRENNHIPFDSSYFLFFFFYEYERDKGTVLSFRSFEMSDKGWEIKETRRVRANDNNETVQRYD